MSASVATLAHCLEQRLAALGSCAVAFSGGVDSSVVAAAAVRTLGPRAIAVTGTSPSMAAGELEQASALAAELGITHRVVATTEFTQPAYIRNAADRCYHCKNELYTRLEQLLPELGVEWMVSGANRDDLGDYRPGLAAAMEHRVVHPLAECGFTKDDVRALAQLWQLRVWDKPATPCLASRVAYGEEVTPERLAQIDRAEQFLRGAGLSLVRVRYHRGDLARIEVPIAELARLVTMGPEVVRHFRELGFRFVTLDLEGFRSGSLNQLVTLSEIASRS